MDAPFRVRIVNARPLKPCHLRYWVPNMRKYPPEIGPPYSYCETHGHKWSGMGDCPTERWVKEHHSTYDPPDFLTKRFLEVR